MYQGGTAPDDPVPGRRAVLAVGAHPDDIELGCGATLAAHVDAGDRVVMLVLSGGERGPGATVAERRAEQEKSVEVIGAELHWGGFPDGRIPDGCETIELIEHLIDEIRPDVVYAHAPEDSHQDHRSVSRAVESAARDVPSLLFYESPTTLSFDPSVFVEVSGTAYRKLASLQAHVSQVTASDRVDLRAIQALLHVRGAQARSGCAEGFAARRLTLPAFSAAAPANGEARASAGRSPLGDQMFHAAGQG
ncbi:PIG-L deacetylase family protein [Streptomyces sp. IBSNAI002]|uniref:PIG-L deacetylase family protein n=1 Tax=Streptomyces sp. IBSNAI002 TaxID=3457500 RepID=UPI003FD0A150